MKGLVTKSILAGFLIACAGAIFLRCDNKIVGALLFSLGLIGVIILKGNLFTGKVGYINNKKTFMDAMVILVINLLVAFAVGWVFQICCGTAAAMDTRITKEWYQVLWDGMICGVCIYLAVECYSKSTNIIMIILPVMAFILSGAEHCVADAFYLGASQFSLRGLLVVGLAAIGNSIGSLLVRWLQINIFEKTGN